MIFLTSNLNSGYAVPVLGDYFLQRIIYIYIYIYIFFATNGLNNTFIK